MEMVDTNTILTFHVCSNNLNLTRSALNRVVSTPVYYYLKGIKDIFNREQTRKYLVFSKILL